MYDIEENIAKIIENGDTKAMEKLSEIFEDALCVVKDCDKELYEKYLMCIYKLAHGSVLTLEFAKDIISKMVPYGEHWTLEQTTAVKNQYGFMNINDIDFWVVMNSAYNDYRDIFKENIEIYAKWSYAFIKDEDADEGKVFKYFTTIPK